MPLNAAKNGCASEIKFHGKYVYYECIWGEMTKEKLGIEILLDEYIKLRVPEEHISKVKEMMVGWQLYENGWYFKSDENLDLFYYLTQITYNRPEALEYFK
jgi:hypothetical protein